MNEKTILITGAARRIGRAMAMHFASRGWHVAAHYGAAHDDAKRLQQDITAQGGTIHLFQADFTTPDAAEALFKQVTQTCGTPRILINNAARFERDDGGITQQSLQSHMAVNAAAPITLAQLMKANIITGAPRFVFNILDRVLGWSWPHLPAYALSKLALEEWTQRNAAIYQPEMYMFGLRLGPTLRNPRESEAHFEKAVSTQTATNVDDILATLDRLIDHPVGQPSLLDI